MRRDSRLTLASRRLQARVRTLRRPPSAAAPACTPEPDRHGQLAALEMLDNSAGESGIFEKAKHRLVGEAQADMGVAGMRDFLALVRGEIDDQQPPARRRAIGQLRRPPPPAILRIMEHLVEDHRLGRAGGGQSERVHVALAQIDQWTRLSKLDPRQAEHFGAAIDAGRARGG